MEWKRTRNTQGRQSKQQQRQQQQRPKCTQQSNQSIAVTRKRGRDATKEKALGGLLLARSFVVVVDAGGGETCGDEIMDEPSSSSGSNYEYSSSSSKRTGKRTSGRCRRIHAPRWGLLGPLGREGQARARGDAKRLPLT